MTPEDTLEELACLYALGALGTEDARAFEQSMNSDPGLRGRVAELRAAADALAYGLPTTAPPPEVKARLMASVQSEETSPLRPLNVTLSTPAGGVGGPAAKSQSSRGRGLLPWAVAAGFSALAAWQWYQFDAADRARELAQQEAVIFETNARAAADQNAELLVEIQKAQAAMARITGERDQAISRVLTIETESESLRTQVARLKEQNDLSNARVAVLGSLIKKNPEARAASVWSSERQSGVLVVENLPALPPGRDYQLWVLDPTKGAPISAGVFQVDDKGAARVAFTAVETVTEPAQFAVTEEQKGGVPAPTMEKLVLAGK